MTCLDRRDWLKAAAAVGAAPLVGVARADGAGGPTVLVEILDYKYIPQTVTVKAGTTVKWVNKEKRTSHSVLFLGPGGFESERMFPDDSWQRRFTEPGDHPYRCGPHPEMTGRIIVE